MTKRLKNTTKSILAWVLVFAMTFANVEPVSAVMLVETTEESAVTEEGTGCGEDVTKGDVSEADVSAGDADVEGTTDGLDETEISADDTLLDSGVWNGLTWRLTEAGVLTISGEDTGVDGYDYLYWDVPWYDYHDSVLKAVVTAKNVKCMSSWFYDCKNLTQVDFSKFDSSLVTDMGSLFTGCESLEQLNLSKLDVSNVTDMTCIFGYCPNLKKLNISGWDVQNVTSMNRMFFQCASLEKLDLSKWNMNNVTDMSEMFTNCEMITELKLGIANSGKLQTLSEMFRNCKALKSIEFVGLNTENVTYMSGMFEYCEKLESIDLSGFDTGKVTDMSAMFYSCSSITELDFSGFDISNVTKMNLITSGCSSLKRIKCFENLGIEVQLPIYTMYDLEGNSYSYRYPTGLNESIWLYREQPLVTGNLYVKEIAPQFYTGKAIKPEIEVYSGSRLLQEKQDYTVSYKNNVNVNDGSNPKKAPTISIKGKGNYNKQDSVTFQILPRDVADIEVKSDNIAKAYNKKVQKPVPVVTFNGKKLVNKKDFTVSYPDLSADNPDAYKVPGTYQILLTGKGNFTGEKMIRFTITEGTLMSKVKIGSITKQEYTGKAVCPKVTVTCGKNTLVEGTDYTLSYENNIQVGKATVIVTGINEKYAGSKKATFQIVGKSLSKAKVSGITDKTYTAKPITQSPIVELDGQAPLVEGKDYIIEYKNNVKPGKATMKIVGTGKYTGTVKKSFIINKIDLGHLSSCGYTPANQYGRDADGVMTVGYNKGGTKLKFKSFSTGGITLVEGKDYTITYLNNIKIITPEGETKLPIARMKGKGCFTGTRDYVYRVVKSDFAYSHSSYLEEVIPITVTFTDMVYSSKPGKFMAKPVIKDFSGKKLTAGVDYEKEIGYFLEDGTKLTKDSMVESGQIVKAVVTGKGNYTGTKDVQYRIMKADIKKAKIKIKPMIYTGNKLYVNLDDIEVAKIGSTDLILNQDFAVKSYKNNVNKGTATVVYRGIGNYGGEKTVTFKIVAKEMIWFWKMFD